jgi:hypothetical protein
MSKFKTSIRVITRLQDNGDGGHTLYGYNSEDELIKDHPLAVNGVVDAETRENILNEDDTYENGYIGEDSIEVEVDTVTQEVILRTPISFHAGQ